jgi:hypothetical protein
MVGCLTGWGLRTLMQGLSQPEPFHAEVELVFASDTPLPIELLAGDAEERARAEKFQEAVRLALTDVPAALEYIGPDEHLRAEWIRTRLMVPRPDLAADAALRSNLPMLAAAATQRWQRLDAAATANWLHEHWSAPLAQVLGDQALEDDPGFIVRVMLQQDGANDQVAHVLSRWAQLDSAGAMQQMETMQPARLNEVMPELGTALAMLPGERLRPWLDQLDPAVQDRLVHELVRTLPEVAKLSRAQALLDQSQALARSAEATQQWFASVSTVMPPALATAVHQDAAVLGIAQGLASHDPAQGLPWLGQLSQGQDRLAHLTLGIEQWLKWDRPQASAWLSSASAVALLTADACDSLRHRYVIATAP